MQYVLPNHVDRAVLAGLTGRVVESVGLTAAVAGLPAPVGAVARIATQSGEEVEAEVIGFRDQHTIVMPLSNLTGVRRGSEVRLVRTARTLPVGPGLLGRVVDARVRTIDGRPQPLLRERRPLESPPIPPTRRPRIDAPLGVGVRAIDGLMTVGRQRTCCPFLETEHHEHKNARRRAARRIPCDPFETD